jgi:putative tryptophan/tyrosine transport system substrate-binding protein
MRRRELIALVGSAAALPLFRAPVVRAEEPGRIYRLGVMTGAPRRVERMAAFFDELKTFGFVEGQNLKIVAGGFELRDDQYTEVAATLTNSAPEVVFCVSDAATRAAEKSTQTLPIVALSDDLLAAGFVRSFSHPGGNITGVSILGAELNGKRLEILMEAVPGVQHIAVLADPNNTPPAELQALQKSARARGVEVAVFTAETPEQIALAMDKAKASPATALNIMSGPLFSFHRRIVIERSAALGLPAIYQWPEMAEEGGMIGYGPRLTLIYRQLARQIVKVLRVVKPEDLPVEQPTTFDLVINLKAANALGLTMPHNLLVLADKVIE